jgi:hypothetical protein
LRVRALCRNVSCAAVFQSVIELSSTVSSMSEITPMPASACT